MPRKPIFDNTDIIIDTAFNIIREEGFYNFSTRRLASKLEVSKNAVFNYLKTKEDIINKVVEKFYTIFVENVLKMIKNNEDHYKKNLFDIYLIIADVLYDMVLEYGDVYKIAIRDFNKTFEPETTTENKFKLLFPVFTFLIDDFKYTEYKEFTEQDFLDKHHLLIVLIINMNTIELNRETKIGKDEYMRLFRKAYSLVME